MHDIYHHAEKVMGMNEATWARHANPWSVYTRFSILPAATLIVWMRAELGGWIVLALLLLGLWTWANPRVFPPARPNQRHGWAAHGTFGERVFLNRSAIAIPTHHLRWAQGLSAASGIGSLIWAYGLWKLDPGWTMCGLIVTMGAKVWFVDRMVWLYRDLAPQYPAYAAWSETRADDSAEKRRF